MFFIKQIGTENWLSFSTKSQAMEYIDIAGGEWEYSVESTESLPIATQLNGILSIGNQLSENN